MKFLLIWICSLTFVQYVAAVCNVCNNNTGVACISDQDFYLCENGQPKNSRTYSCSGNQICTGLPAICVNRTETNAVLGCGDTSNCGICNGTTSEGTFACTSRTTYTLCMGGALTDIRDSCPEYQICDIAVGRQGRIPCVPSCREPVIEFCDRIAAIDGPVATTQLPTTTITNMQSSTIGIIAAGTPATATPTTTTTTATSNTTQVSAANFCSQQEAVGRYPLPNDSSCKNYVLCYKKGGIMQATTGTCGKNTYFNPTLGICTRRKPLDCI